MQELTYSSHFEAPAESVYDWHERALRRLIPPWTDVDVVGHEGIAEESSAELRLHAGPFRVRWLAEHTDVVPGKRFTDVQVRGPFAAWRHTHRMTDEEDGCRLSDEIIYRLPLAGPSERLVGDAVRRKVDRMFAYRHRTTRNDLRLHALYGRRKLRVAVSGSSGLIGSALVAFLEAGGHDVLRIVRSKPRDPNRDVYWNYREQTVESEKLEGLDAVVHLAGENVLVPRWSEQKKMDILGSRVRGTEHLARTLAELEQPPRILLSASGIGFYGNCGEERLDESSPPGDDGFMSAVCQEWERATVPAANAGIRSVHLRLGIVLTPAGGILAPLLLPFQLGLGGRYGGARQYLSWIGLDDVLGAVYHLLHADGVEGPVNVTSPAPVTMAEFARTLGTVLSRPAAVRLPPALIRAVLGDVADEAALMSVRAFPRRLESTDYAFLHPSLEDMLRHALGRTLKPVGSGAEHRVRRSTQAATTNVHTAS